MTEKQKEKLCQKYEKALAILTGKKLDDTDIMELFLESLLEEKEEESIDSIIDSLLEEPAKGKEMLQTESKEKKKYPEHEVSVYQQLDKLRKEILANGKEIMKEHRFEIFAAIDQMLSLLYIAKDDGLEPLCKEGKRLLESDLESDRFIG